MGNHISHGHGSPATGKLILPDGSIQEFNEPISVAELMLEHPKQVVIELKEASQRRERLTPLPADKKLEVHEFYVMVPLRSGRQAHLSPQEAHLILLRASMVLKSKTTLVSTSKFLPLFARIWPVGSGIEDWPHCKIAVPKKDALALKEREMEELHGDGVESSGHFEWGEYLKRKVSGKGWKPSLGTIEEKKCESSEVSNWVSLATKVGKRIEHKGLVWG